MVSYSAINWIPNAIGPAINTILRQKLGFDGFVISDYDEMQRIMDQQLPTNFNIMDKRNLASFSLPLSDAGRQAVLQGREWRENGSLGGERVQVVAAPRAMAAWCW